MSQRHKRAVRAALAGFVVIATVGLIQAPAVAQPPTSPSDPRKQYEELGEQASKANEDLLQAEEDLKANQAALERANADLVGARDLEAQARTAQDQFRGQVDQFAAASFQGARLTQLSALFTGRSQEDLLDRASALHLLATQNNRALDDMSATVVRSDDARRLAEDAQRRAQAATDAAARLTDEARARKADLNTKMAEVKRALNALSPADKADLGQVKDNGVYLGPPGAANDAMQAALSKRGSEYEWAAEGPNEFDCSGLTSWAYAQAGVAIPRTSRSQYTVGRAVSINELQPGDLVFYDDGTGNPSRIHHVGMYVGAGRMVDAPTEGQLVDVRSIKGDGHYIGARRIVG